MTMARSRLVDPSVTRWYHCMTRCVRGADLLAKAPEYRNAWRSNSGCKNSHKSSRWQLGGFSVMDNHLRRPVAASIPDVDDNQRVLVRFFASSRTRLRSGGG